MLDQASVRFAPHIGRSCVICNFLKAGSQLNRRMRQVDCGPSAIRDEQSKGTLASQRCPRRMSRSASIHRDALEGSHHPQGHPMRSTQWLPLFTLLLSGGTAIAQDLPTTAATRAALVPAGWQIEAEASGDLDADGRLDVALVLAGAGIDISSEAEALVGPRRLVIAFGAKAGYERVITNSQLIPPTDDPDMDDIFDAASDAMRITDGNLVLDLRLFSWAGGWNMWTKTYTFHWQEGAFALALFDWSDVDRSTGEITLTTADYGAQTIKITHGNISNEIETTEIETLPSTGIVTLGDIADGMAFEP